MMRRKRVRNQFLAVLSGLNIFVGGFIRVAIFFSDAKVFCFGREYREFGHRPILDPLIRVIFSIRHG